MADILSGYVIYAPASLLIKGLMALTVSRLCPHCHRKGIASGLPHFPYPLACAIAELIMVSGYLLYDAFALSYGAGALLSVPGNFLQGMIGVACALMLKPVVHRLAEG